MNNYFNSVSDRICKFCNHIDVKPIMPNQNVYKGNGLVKSLSNFDCKYPIAPVLINKIVNLSEKYYKDTRVCLF